MQRKITKAEFDKLVDRPGIWNTTSRYSWGGFVTDTFITPRGQSIAKQKNRHGIITYYQIAPPGTTSWDTGIKTTGN